MYKDRFILQKSLRDFCAYFHNIRKILTKQEVYTGDLEEAIHVENILYLLLILISLQTQFYEQ